MIGWRFLESFWTELRQRYSDLRVQPRDPNRAPFAYFEDPKLLFQVHDTNNAIVGQSLTEAFDVFCDEVLGGLQLHYLDFRSCWVDIGFRDMPSTYSSPQGQDIPVTLLWKRDCHDYYDRVIKEAALDIALKPERFRTFNLRDVATYTAKAHSSKRGPSTLDPGNPNYTKSGVLRAKAYHCNKELFSVMFSDYQTFGSQHLSAPALPDDMITHLFSMGHNSANAILPTKEVNDLISALACRFIKPLNYIFSLAPRLANHGRKARAVVYYYTAKLFMRPLLLSLTGEREYSFDKWIWERTCTVRKREGARQVTYRRTGLDLKTTLQSAGVVWLRCT
ncbi:hypothetical protein TOPH_09246 [Tolypocladium ophioglossoides CBS 100239]|uniref:Uncharacterized protein n=1 Tax=Tolypocladium ophioglossoides (strain CBS 100239) TaxID=1163406 RepID=A0A0L0MW80_TOLOC|nr:hypothetical protein TOPH_09246 [Tolypocladium ophioglossoides CBS 100239]